MVRSWAVRLWRAEACDCFRGVSVGLILTFWETFTKRGTGPRPYGSNPPCAKYGCIAYLFNVVER
jgi:hypothetical protein